MRNNYGIKISAVEQYFKIWGERFEQFNNKELDTLHGIKIFKKLINTS